MLIKLMTVRTADPDAFHRAQLAWDQLRDVPGFLGQDGGWSRDEAGVAHIVGCWQDRASYDAFMAGPHDRILGGRPRAYDSIEVQVVDLVPDWTVRPGGRVA
jgi:hypothetical protein